MSRPRQFDEPAVLQRLAEVFSRHGYEGTSMAMLVEATGLGKQSLYNAFGDKRAMYARAVDAAVAGMAPVAHAVRSAATGRAALLALFDHLARSCASTGAERHCIVSQGLLEGGADADIDAQLRAQWSATRELVRSAVARGQGDGSIVNPQPAGVLADVLMSLQSGLRVMAQADVGPRRLNAAVAAALALLDAAPQAAALGRPPKRAKR
jgi:TetR/AcrR family transcriptional repressor of nem operon